MDRIDYLSTLSDLGSPPDDGGFQQIVLGYHRAYGRSFPWRDTTDPYSILVSEVMLQQTQTDRVIPKYRSFLEAFPTVSALADASQADVLNLWAGLGYYRRARNLYLTAKAIAGECAGVFPRSFVRLKELPGVGPYTAAAVAAFAFGEPVPMIETNVRTVYLSTYFRGEQCVPDKRILPVIERTLHRPDPRTWYYALMDFGSFLKRHLRDVNQQSAHYTRQSPYKGSVRQARAAVLRAAAASPRSLSTAAIRNVLKGRGLDHSGERVATVIETLCREGLMVRERDGYGVP